MNFVEGAGSGIFIANTTDSFVIRQWALWEASSEIFQAGIVLQNVTNARLENNNCHSNGWCGIYLEQTEGSVLQDNWCWDNFQTILRKNEITDGELSMGKSN